MKDRVSRKQERGTDKRRSYVSYTLWVYATPADGFIRFKSLNGSTPNCKTLTFYIYGIATNRGRQMPNHANFAAAICIRQEKIQEFLRIYYHEHRISHNLIGSALGYSVDMFVDLPQIELSSRYPQGFILNLKGWGFLGVPVSGSSERRLVKIEARITVEQSITINNGNLQLGLDPSRGEILLLRIEVLEGRAFSLDAQALLDGDLFRGMVGVLLRTQMSSLSSIVAPLSLGMLGRIASDSGTRVFSKALNNTLLVGLDCNITGYVTNGNPDLLTDFTNGMHIAIYINPSVLNLVLEKIHQSISSAVAEQSATLNSLSNFLQEGSIHIDGNASKTEGSVNFSLDAVPHLIRPGRHEIWTEEDGRTYSYNTPDRGELWFSIQNLYVSISRPAWLVFLEVLSPLIAGAIAESLLFNARHNIEAGITTTGGRTINNTTQWVNLRGITDPPIMMRLQRYECHPDGILMGITLTINFTAGKLDGPDHIAVEELARIPQYRIRLPYDLHTEDPLLNIRWSLRRTTDNSVILNEDGHAYALLSQSLRNDAAAMSRNRCQTYIISVRVYRTLGAEITDFYNDSMTLRIADRLDRSHPFVRWTHEVYVPIVIVESDGSRILSGYEVKTRHSKIHRTGCPGRCKMVTRFSKWVSTDASTPQALEYLDRLPFYLTTQEEIIANRRYLCDYCFFGGPDKSRLLV